MISITELHVIGGMVQQIVNLKWWTFDPNKVNWTIIPNNLFQIQTMYVLVKALQRAHT